ncbi:unnamed protein product [Pylaiella littoralis]
MIGVAAPGIELNLRILTSSLKDRYLRTQTVLYPVVEKIRTFTSVHASYLDYLQTEADKYSATNPPTDEDAIAQANIYIAHVSYWSNIIDDAITGVAGTVNVMAEDGQDVKRQLKIQLSVIEQELVKLEIVLADYKTEKSEYEKELNKAIGLLVGGALAFLVIPFFGVFIGSALLVTGAISKKSISDGLSDVNKV